MAFSQDIFKISIPLTEIYTPVRDLINEASTVECLSVTNRIKTDSKSTLQTWFCTPSYGRARISTMDYSYTMITDDQKLCTYLHFIFVRSEEFKEYCQHWDKSHVIVQLPETMYDICEGVESGIGYARLFIQRFARSLMQDFIFMVDDNINCIEEVCTQFNPEDGQEYLVRQGKDLVTSRVPLFRVLSHLERQFLDDNIQRQSGPVDDYGVLGLLMFRPGVYRIQHPFKRTHVYALVLLNLRSLERKNIEYKPLQHREDIELNRDCSKAGLIVCKYNRFILRKLQLRSNIIDRCRDSPVIKPCNDSLYRICEWIRDIWLPGHVEIVPSLLVNKELRECQQIFSCFSHTDSSCHLVILVGKNHDLLEYFREATGISHFNNHLILLKNYFFDTYEMNWKRDFEDNIVRYMFQNEYALSMHSRTYWVFFHVVGKEVIYMLENEMLREEIRKMKAEIHKLEK